MFRNPYSFLLGSGVDEETKAKIKKFKEKQSELIDEMRKMQRDIRDEAYNQLKKKRDQVENLYEDVRNIISIERAEDYRYFMSTILDNMVRDFASNRPLLPPSLPPRSILKLYMSGCRYCQYFANPLSSIADLFLPGSLLALEYNRAMEDPYLRTVVDELKLAGWGGGVPAWFLLEPDATGKVSYISIDVPSWPSLLQQEKEDPDRARVKLASILKEQLVAEKMAQTVSEISAQNHLDKAKEDLQNAERYGRSFKRERKALKHLLEAENADPVVSKMQQLMRSYRDEKGKRYNPLDLEDETLSIILMDPAFRIPRYSSLYRSDITDYYLGLNESAKKAAKVSTAAAPAATTGTAGTPTTPAAPTNPSAGSLPLDL